MRLSHGSRGVVVRFDERNLVSCAGLVPVMQLAEQVSLAGLVDARVRPDLPSGARPGGKAAAIVAGMVAGADSIDDLDLLRHGGMEALFEGVYAPSTLGSFLRFFTWGHSLQLEAASRTCWPLWLGGCRCCPVRVSRFSWMWTRCCGGCTDTPSRAQGSAMPRSAATGSGCVVCRR